MSSNRCLKLLPVLGILAVLAACVQTERPAAQTGQTGQTMVAKPAGSCQGDDGPIADGTIVAKCALPGQGIVDCPQYLCRKCNGGNWTGEYACRLQ
ncbi:hypothetical protein [Trinickia fusca]|uniref:hypothetical protein n=1 Tax=Trinickia fusca TaxID=2419777 RepID=UPI0011C36281|nr:hypothetical protein [Trinickia fusca]